MIEALGVSRTQSYLLKARIEAALPDCQRPVGRPAGPPAPVSPPDLRGQVIRFVYAHPACVHGGLERQRYSDAFRLFVLDLAAEHATLSLPALADGICIPEVTLRDWLRGDRPHVDPPQTAAVARSPTIPQVETVLNAWDTWEGGFLKFSAHGRSSCGSRSAGRSCPRSSRPTDRGCRNAAAAGARTSSGCAGRS